MSDLAPWDLAFYSEAGKRAIQLTQSASDYFPLEGVLQGAFEAHRLYGLHFKKNVSVPVYHEDVDVYEVVDDSAAICRFFTPISILEKGKELVRG